ncbi:hypothetical protein O4J56_14065 [Nocardiopsis sp. RSe5-2]|uniref:Uncharacterized protein n=1 Tax=Nocardiopsis endophytica TaxID=3018445 RepID=A0ABT4U482_9ACTN|nr:hypothetical protein [Nocardiopsis endophytica]MDA2811763.1 hypothetical protein [Nocardiopsis endophytica]
MRPTDNGDRPRRLPAGTNTRHPAGIRIVAAVLAVAALVLGPLGYVNGTSADTGSASEWYTLGFAASAGLPLLAAAITTVAGDRRAALWCLALLAWPPVFIAAVHLAPGA